MGAADATSSGGRRARSSSKPRHLGDASQLDRSSAYSQRSGKYVSIDSSDPEVDWGRVSISSRAESQCISELVEELQRRLLEQGDQIAQLQVELGSRTRVAAAFANSRSGHV